MNIKTDAIRLDVTIQCRAKIDPDVISDYAEAMTEGAIFPPVVLFGSVDHCWPGDGWHRIMAAKQVGYVDVDADLRPGGRTEALKYALAANAVQGQRRTNADKRRTVDIAMREFPKLSSRAIAEMCSVSADFTARLKKDVSFNDTLQTVTGKDGKVYPARNQRKHEDDEPSSKELPKLGPPRNGMDFARIAIMKLSEIRPDDLERSKALTAVLKWIESALTARA
jgi:hypothetical protein